MSARSLIAALALAAACFGPAAPAEALDVAPERARVFFSNGGRIISMNADGTDRVVVFGKERSPKNDALGAIEPDVSPDGRTVVFGFRREGRFENYIDVWKVRADGGGARRLLVSKPGSVYGDPAFDPDGRIVVAFLRSTGRFTRTGLLSMARDGSSKRKVFEARSRKRPYRSAVSVMEPAVSPDGKKVLYLLNEGASGATFDEGFENPVMVRDLASGKTRRIAERGYGAAWSPDGRRIAYAVQAESDPEICWWEYKCSFLSSIAVIRSDGSGRRFLTGRTLDERSPDWSEDGRIVFHSARNVPGAGEAYEIYSIRPDGSCLTMLTNGSPASMDPVWSGDDGGSTAPAACGAKPPRTGVELRLPPRLEEREGFWLGKNPVSRLLTGFYGEKDFAFSLYLDCSWLAGAGCERPLGLVSSDICAYRGSLAESLAGAKSIRRQRGVPVFRSDGAEIGPFTLLYAGRSVVYFFGGSGGGDRIGTKEVGQLRSFSQPAPEGDLPPVRFPSFDLRLIEKVEAAHRSAGSVAAAARRLDRSVGFVRRNLRASKRLSLFGEYGSVNCPPVRSGRDSQGASNG